MTSVWVAGGLVAVGAAVATAHGLFDVAVAAGLPAGIAWLYPLITDGLALIAYAATTRLTGTAARYAWTVVVLAAGLSGLAQATYLAATPAGPAGPGPAGAGGSGALLRFGVGYWPALAAAITAHLLYLLAGATRFTPPPPGATEAVDTAVSTPMSVRALYPAGVPDVPGVPGVPGVPAGRTAAADRSAEIRARVPGGVHPTLADDPHRPLSDGAGTAPPPGPAAAQPRDRAAQSAHAYRRAHGAWPSVRTLATAAAVSHGTAQAALQMLRTDTTSTDTSSETQP